jgi:hypothetical protein
MLVHIRTKGAFATGSWRVHPRHLCRPNLPDLRCLRVVGQTFHRRAPRRTSSRTRWTVSTRTAWMIARQRPSLRPCRSVESRSLDHRLKPEARHSTRRLAWRGYCARSASASSRSTLAPRLDRPSRSVDLATLPHILFAGASGSGKSMWLLIALLCLVASMGADVLDLIITTKACLSCGIFAERWSGRSATNSSSRTAGPGRWSSKPD